MPLSFLGPLLVFLRLLRSEQAGVLSGSLWLILSGSCSQAQGLSGSLSQQRNRSITRKEFPMVSGSVPLKSNQRLGDGDDMDHKVSLPRTKQQNI